MINVFSLREKTFIIWKELICVSFVGITIPQISIYTLLAVQTTLTAAESRNSEIKDTRH